MSTNTVHPSRLPTGEERYHVEFLNRRGSRVWCVPLAGTTITRPSALVPANAGRPVLVMTYQHACSLADGLNVNRAILGMVGKCFPVLSRPRVDLMEGCREIYG